MTSAQISAQDVTGPVKWTILLKMFSTIPTLKIDCFETELKIFLNYSLDFLGSL